MAQQRIQLLPTPDLLKWWQAQVALDDEKGTKKAQDRLREALRIGIEVLEGRAATISPEQSAIYAAIETLLRTGVIPAPAIIEPSPEPPKTAKRPQLGRTRDAFDEMRRN